MAYYPPPTSTPEFKNDVKKLRDAAAANYDIIASSLIEQAATKAGVTPTIRIDVVRQMFEKFVIGTTHVYEGGYSAHPNEGGGACMRGVTVNAFRMFYEYVFINSDVSTVKTAAKAVSAKYSGWKTDSQIAKQFLYELFSDTKVAALWIYVYACKPGDASKGFRSPIIAMAEDPWLGYLFFEGVWLVGGGLYGPKATNLDGIARQFGWNGNVDNWLQFINTLGDKTPEFATKVFTARLNHLIRLSKPGAKQEAQREGWMNRMYRWPNSNLMMVVVLNELFNLNTKGYFQFDDAEKAHLNRKAEIYKTFKISI
jgi:hypothetical protein